MLRFAKSLEFENNLASQKQKQSIFEQTSMPVISFQERVWLHLGCKIVRQKLLRRLVAIKFVQDEALDKIGVSHIDDKTMAKSSSSNNIC